MKRSNNSFERPCGVGGPRLAAAWASRPAAQLNRYAAWGKRRD
jgi:hypothetical protein